MWCLRASARLRFWGSPTGRSGPTPDVTSPMRTSLSGLAARNTRVIRPVTDVEQHGRGRDTPRAHDDPRGCRGGRTDVVTAHLLRRDRRWPRGTGSTFSERRTPAAAVRGPGRRRRRQSWTSGASSSKNGPRSPPDAATRNRSAARRAVYLVGAEARRPLAHVRPRPARSLADCRLGPVEHRRDLRVRVAERLAQDVHDPLQGREGSRGRPAGRTRRVSARMDPRRRVSASVDWLGQPFADVRLPAGRDPAEAVEGQARGHRDGGTQPGRGHRTRARTRPPQPCLLHDVLGVGRPRPACDTPRRACAGGLPRTRRARRSWSVTGDGDATRRANS